ncbi:hypothetical protein BMR04_13345 [Methylococcaceae bacterium HT3]|nr:hypothetical protein BMR04_13345 [Methylococcaceae bacterium HT3]
MPEDQEVCAFDNYCDRTNSFIPDITADLLISVNRGMKDANLTYQIFLLLSWAWNFFKVK